MINTKSKTWIIGLLSLCLAACGSSTPSGDDEPLAPVPIGFSADIIRQEGVQTKGVAVTDISDMYVFASYTGANDWSPVNTPNFMYKQFMEKASGGEWTYTPLKYWPAARDKISFFAYAPATLTGVVPSAADKQGPQLTYTLPVTESARQDLLAGSCLNRTNENGGVVFTMKHALTQVKFKIKNGEASSINVVLTGLKILMPGTGTLCFEDAVTSGSSSSSGPSSGKTFAWASYGAQATLTADVRLGSGKTISLDGTDQEAAAFFLLPLEDPSQAVTLQLTYTLKRVNPAEEPVTLIVPVSPPANPAWTPSTSISYTIAVKDDRLEVEEVTSISDFTEGNTGVTGGDITAT